MSIAYDLFSKQAVQSEHLGNFEQAAELWQQATPVALGKNIAWTEVRAEFCQKAAERNGESL